MGELNKEEKFPRSWAFSGRMGSGCASHVLSRMCCHVVCVVLDPDGSGTAMHSFSVLRDHEEAPSPWKQKVPEPVAQGESGGRLRVAAAR